MLVISTVFISLYGLVSGDRLEKTLNDWLETSPAVQIQAEIYRRYLESQDRQEELKTLLSKIENEESSREQIGSLLPSPYTSRPPGTKGNSFQAQRLFVVSESDADFSNLMRAQLKKADRSGTSNTLWQWKSGKLEYQRLKDLYFPYQYGIVPKTLKVDVRSASQLVSYGFFHQNTPHLVTNLVALWIFGIAVEPFVGPFGFGLLYLLALIFAGMMEASASLHSGAPIIGASGAVFFVVGLFSMGFMRSRIRLFYLLAPLPIFGTLFVRASYFLILWLGFQFLGAIWALAYQDSSVAHVAHLSGFGLGVLVGSVLRKRYVPLLFPDVELTGKWLNLLYAADQEIHDDRAADARLKLIRLLNAFPQNLSLHQAIYQVAMTRLKDRPLLFKTAPPVIEQDIRHGNYDRAARRYNEVMRMLSHAPPLAPQYHLLLAKKSEAQGRHDLAAYLYASFALHHANRPEAEAARQKAESMANSISTEMRQKLEKAEIKPSDADSDEFAVDRFGW